MGAYGATPSSNMKVVQTLAPVSLSASGTGSLVVDTQGFDGGFATFIVNVAAESGSGSMVFRVQEDDNSGFSSASDVTGAAFASISAANDETTYYGVVQIQGRQRYLRLAWAETGTFTALCSGACVLTGPGDTADAGTASFTVTN